MRKLKNLALGMIVFMLASSIAYAGNVPANPAHKHLAFNNAKSVYVKAGTPIILSAQNIKTVVFEGKIVNGKFVNTGKRANMAALDPTKYYIVFGYQTEGTNEYDLRLQLG